MTDLAWRRLLKEYGVNEVVETRSLNAVQYRLIRDDDVVTFHVLDEEVASLTSQREMYFYLKELIVKALTP